MSETELSYPIFRQLAGGGHLYRIEAADRFVELQRIGSRWVRHEVQAGMYPEKVRIMEMIDDIDGRFLPLSAAAWEVAEVVAQG